MQQAITAQHTLTSEDDLHSPQPSSEATSHLSPPEMLVDVAVRREFLRRIARMLQGKRQPTG